MIAPHKARSGRIFYTVAVFVVLASVDNTAAALYPVLTNVIADDFGADTTRVASVTALVILVAALTAVAWGYFGDRSSRKPLLFWATLVWCAGLLLASRSSSLTEFAIWSALFAIGLGAIASVGFSVISDFISPRRRGLAMSFWG
ncbi:MAG: MFS transporter, partial [Acidimicrobiia bacterium]|nr:MFS transporter [Acidimicrobiia bacterium]